MTTWHPWRSLRGNPHLVLHVVPLARGRVGDTDGKHLIRLAPGLLQTERRCTLTHELVHVERGDTECSSSDEVAVQKESARRLIPLIALADALLWAGPDLIEAADELWVDIDTLQTRLTHLHPAERGYLKRRLAMKEETA